MTMQGGTRTPAEPSGAAVARDPQPGRGLRGVATVVGVLLLALAGVSLWSWQRVRSDRAELDTWRDMLRTEQGRTALAAGREALAGGDAVTALALALEAAELGPEQLGDTAGDLARRAREQQWERLVVAYPDAAAVDLPRPRGDILILRTGGRSFGDASGIRARRAGGEIALWDTRGNRLLKTPPADGSVVDSAWLSVSGTTRLATAGQDGIVLSRPDDASASAEIIRLDGPATAAAFADVTGPDGATAPHAAVAVPGAIELWDLQARTRIASVPEQEVVDRVVLAAMGAPLRLVAVTRAGQAKLHLVAPGGDGRAASIRSVLLGPPDCTFRSAANPAAAAEPPCLLGRVTGAEFNADATLVVGTWSQERGATVWEVQDGRERAAFTLPCRPPAQPPGRTRPVGQDADCRASTQVEFARFEGDGRTVLLASRSTLARGTLGVPGTAPVYQSGRDDRILDISQDGAWFLVRGAEASRATALEVGGPGRFILAGHEGPIVAARLNGIAGRVLTGSDDGTLRLWEFRPPGQPGSNLMGIASDAFAGARALRQALPRCLSEARRKAFGLTARSPGWCVDARVVFSLEGAGR